MVYHNQNEPLSANYLMGPKRQSKFDSGLEPVLSEVKHSKHSNISIQHKHHAPIRHQNSEVKEQYQKIGITV